MDFVLTVTVDNAESIDDLVLEIEASGAAGPEASITVDVEDKP